MRLTDLDVPKRHSPPVQSQAWLDIGAWHAAFAALPGAAREDLRDLPIGACRIAEELFRHDPPRPAELETAIDVVEDQVMRVADRWPQAQALRVTGPFAGAIRDALGADPRADAIIGLEAVERLFQRLASASLGQSAARRGLPSGNAFVAAVLVLREFMHHLGFASVELRPGAA